MIRKLLYLINPISGVKKKPLLKASIEQKTKAAGIEFIIADTRADGDYSYLPGYISKNKITDIIICGGDGSVSTVTAYLLDTDVNVGIVPMGSGNGLALAAGIPNSTARALDIVFKGRASYIDGFYINDKFSCMMCGIGSDAQIAHDFAIQKTRGLKTYLRLSALHYFKSKPFPFSIQFENKSLPLEGPSSPLGSPSSPFEKGGVSPNGETGDFHYLETDAFFIVIANSNQFGNNVTIAPKASLNDGLLDIVIVNKMHKLVLPFALLHQITGINTLKEIDNYKRSKNILYFQTPELKITNKGNAPIHIDGEPELPAEIITIKIRPNAFRLLQSS